jgi:hypothetical protein
MKRIRTRRRTIDTLVVLASLCLMAWPFLTPTQAAVVGGLIQETQVGVDQSVKQSALISQPLNGDFDMKWSGKSVGKVDWDVYTSANEGFKLSVSSDGTPAMRDKNGSSTVNDYQTKPSSWSVGSGDRRFGFSSEGPQALENIYDQGKKWRGFTGKVPIEVARRRTGPVSVTRTTVWFAAEMRAPLPSSARPRSWVVATAMMNI